MKLSSVMTYDQYIAQLEPLHAQQKALQADIDTFTDRFKQAVPVIKEVFVMVDLYLAMRKLTWAMAALAYMNRLIHVLFEEFAAVSKLCSQLEALDKEGAQLTQRWKARLVR